MSVSLLDSYAALNARRDASFDVSYRQEADRTLHGAPHQFVGARTFPGRFVVDVE